MRPTRERYAAAVEADGRRLAEAASSGLDTPVPSCPGWTVADVVRHTGVIHRHKERIVRERLLANPDRETPPDDAGLIAWFLEGVERLVATLATTDPATEVVTFHPPDQSAGFWQRRMAHETAIHRVDVELAHHALTPLDPDIAADGVDEVLGPVRAAVADDVSFGPDGRVVLMQTRDTGDIWHLVLGTGPNGFGWRWAEGGAADPVAVITATADVLDRWAWGRADEDEPAVEGDTGVVSAIRTAVARVT
ncbi:MAG TPA: maleylpyruvate isomerase family mycothiol-dependent enzyme [Acidimicrobiia bacterium]|nr:maleylpyruvate isomerase family mycothiol-dependent enzyme [Acidimicrobiia bacterium]